MASEYSLTIRDYSNEMSKVRVNITTLTAGNFAATMGLLDTLSTAIQGVILGVRASESRVADAASLSNGTPSDKTAQRENKWLVRSEDNVTHKVFRNEIPTADLSLLETNSDMVTDLSAGALATLKSAWEAVVKSPEGNACTMRSLQFVGKRL